MKSVIRGVLKRLGYEIRKAGSVSHRVVEPRPPELPLLVKEVRSMTDGIIFFDEDWYLAQLPNQKISDPLLHYLVEGSARGLSPHPLFDGRFYLGLYVDVARSGMNPLVHYLKYGAAEKRRPHPTFDPAVYEPGFPGEGNRALGEHGESVSVTGPGHNIDEARHAAGFETKVASLYNVSSADVSLSALKGQLGGTYEDLYAMTVSYFEEKMDSLGSLAIQDQMAKAVAIEPLIMTPRGSRRVTAPPMVHGSAQLAHSLGRLRAAVPYTSVDTIVLLPHCRVAGSARVSGEYVKAVRALWPGERVLVVLTDLSAFERPDWFGIGEAPLDFAGIARSLNPQDKMLMLIDLIQGLKPARIVNINSKLAWDTIYHYGRQLSTFTKLHAYLFTSDRSPEGHPVGYPIYHFQECFDYLTSVVIDNAALRQDLIDRYAFAEPDIDRLRLAYTPIDVSSIDPIRLAGPSESLRALWIGRLDRQKRFDLVVEIAEAMPDLQIQAWGDVILGGLDVDFDNLPSNIEMMGTYDDLDELDLSEFDFFLYTSEWDGLPTILLDIAARGLPIVGARVGGTGELLTEETGFPVDDATRSAGYLEMIDFFLDHRIEGSERANRARQALSSLCNSEDYRREIVASRELEVATPTAGPTVVAVPPVHETCDLDITVVITAHSEGVMAGISKRSLIDAVDQAKGAGLSVEVLVMLDRPTEPTLTAFSDVQGWGWQVHEVDFGDQGKTRNHGVRLARGSYVAFLDADDLFGEDWLLRAHRMCEQDRGRFIAHAEFNWFFQGSNSTFCQLDQRHPFFTEEFLRAANYWDALSLTPRQILVSHPFCDRDIKGGFALEDWHWNRMTVEAGYIHVAVPGTIHFKRRRGKVSQNLEVARTRALVRPTAMSDYAWYGSEI